KVSMPHFSQAAAAERLLERAVDQAYAQSRSANQLRRCRILRQFRTQRFDATAIIQQFAQPQHALALRESQSDRIGYVLPSRLVGAEKSAFEFRPQVRRTRTDGRRTDEPRPRTPGRQQALYVVARHQYVAVGDHDPRAGRGSPSFDNVIELGIS